MNPLVTALRVEADKLHRATVARVAGPMAVILVLLTTAGGFAAAERAAGTSLGAKSAALIAAPGWPGYTGLAAMSVGASTLLAVGIVMAWSVGREFTDGTVVGLFALPVSPAGVCLAKTVVTVGWAAALATIEGVSVAVAGVLLGLPAPGAPTCAGAVTAVGIVLSVGALPVVWVATIGRGYLAGIAAALVIVVVTNVAAGFGLGSALPWALPVLWATPGADVSGWGLLAPVAVGAAGAALAVRSWARLQLGTR